MGIKVNLNGKTIRIFGQKGRRIAANQRTTRREERCSAETIRIKVLWKSKALGNRRRQLRRRQLWGLVCEQIEATKERCKTGWRRSDGGSAPRVEWSRARPKQALPHARRNGTKEDRDWGARAATKFRWNVDENVHRELQSKYEGLLSLYSEQEKKVAFQEAKISALQGELKDAL